MGLLGVPFEWKVGEGGWGSYNYHHPSLKLVRVFLESSQSYVVSENIPISTKALLILLMSEGFCNKIAFFAQNSTFTQSNSGRAVLKIF